MMKEAERKREERYMVFCNEQSEKNRANELLRAEILSRSHQQFPMQRLQQLVTSEIESQFLSYHIQVEAQKKKVTHTKHNKVQHLWQFSTAGLAAKIRNETIYMHIKKQSQFVVENVTYFVSHYFFCDVFRRYKKVPLRNELTNHFTYLIIDSLFKIYNSMMSEVLIIIWKPVH